ncbi:MAG: M3 family metallopeptidase [Holophaga sp.]|jgi:peptidyl-dipeptidase Dcp
MAVPAPENLNPRNPFFQKWETPFETPPFDCIRPEHYLPAFQTGIRRHNEEVRAILKSRSAPTFRNTVEALEDSGEFLDLVNGIFSAMVEADSNSELQAVALAVGPLLSGHLDDIYQNEALFQRVQAVHERGEDLPPEARTLLEKTRRSFIRGGAGLPGARQARLRELNAELSLLSLKFEQNLLAETNAFKLVVERTEDLEGLSGGDLEAATEAAKMCDLEGRWVFNLHAPSLWPFLEHARNRDLRRRMLKAYISRCDRGNAQDNNGLAARITALRGEKARLLGFSTYADYALEESMAKSPANAYRLLEQVWAPALRRAAEEKAELQAFMDRDLPGARLEPWDWRYYTEQVKKARFGLDDQELLPYFPLEQVREGAFRTANRLFGITFNERRDLPVYHPEVRAYLVQDRDGGFLGIYYADYHPRPGKRGGAWMECFRRQWVRNGRDVRPLVYNVTNFPRPLGETPALLNLEEVRTLFHEFGHAVHGLLSRCRYRSLSGTATALDFSELPSQIMENWATEPEVLAMYARHHKTGTPLPGDLVERIQASQAFNQGFGTTECLAAAFLDLDWHTLTDSEPVDAAAFERASMDRIGLLPQVPVRHRTPYFAHSMGGEYAAGYYGYLWSAVLDADAFQAFKERGDPFDPATARSFRANILERGGSEDPLELYRRFRGRDPSVVPLLRKRGLD